MHPETEHWAIRLRVRLLRPYWCRRNRWIRRATAWLELHTPNVSKR